MPKGRNKGMAFFQKEEKVTKEINEIRQEENIAKENNVEKYRDSVGNENFIIPLEDFGPLREFVEDTRITDVDWNGTDLWITNIENEKIKITDKAITDQLNEGFINAFTRKIANVSGAEFNRTNPVVEAETKELRISMVHSYVAQTGESICIRKTPSINRITEKYAIDTLYASKEVISLLANCIKAHMNIVVAGQPRAGKTELAKFLSTYIPDEERVITIEDVMEWRYKEFRPTADCVEMKTNSKIGFDYSKGIIASLKQNPRWIMIAETRGQEVADLINSFTTGVNGITTLHTDSVRKIPQRMVNMTNDSSTEERMLNNIFEFVDVGIMISFRKDKNGRDYRIIDEIGFFTFDPQTGTKDCRIVVKDGDIIYKSIAQFPSQVKDKFEIVGIKDAYYNKLVNKRLQEQGYKVDEKKATKRRYAAISAEYNDAIAEAN